jgi:hypothetical protein
VLIAARPREAARHAHAQAVERLQARAVGAHVAHARLRVLGDAEGGGEKEEEDSGGPQYADGFTKSLKVLEISLDESDDWMDIYRGA